MNSLSIEVLAPRYEIAWYPWAVQYFFMIALSYGALLLALPGVLLGRRDWQATARLALLACVTTAVVAPVALLADLHQPLRFWHFYAFFTPWSWMSLGSLFLPLYVVSVLGLAWLVWRTPLRATAARPGLGGRIARLVTLGDWQSPRLLVRLVALAALAAALAIMVYTGSEVAILKGRPLWHTAWLPVFFVSTALFGAAGLVLLLNRFAGRRAPQVDRQMLLALLAAVLATGLVAAGWLAEGLINRGSSVAAALDSVRYSPDWRGTALWGLLAGLALLFGTALLLLRPGLRGGGAWLLGLLGLHTAWMARWVVLMDVQTVARHSAGYHHYGIAAGSQGWLGIIGTFGLWLALLLVIDLLVPWRAALDAACSPESSSETAPETAPETAADHPKTQAAETPQGLAHHG